MTDKKEIWAWVMYDFANSPFTTLIVTFIYATFFTKVIAPDEITGTLFWSRGVTMTAVLVALFSPVLGAIADQGGLRKLLLLFTTALTIFSTVMLYFPLPGQITLALTWFVIANVSFELCNVFYNAILPEIADEKMIGRISGYGWGAGYIGGLIAMLIAMVAFVNPEIPWFGVTKTLGENIRATNILVALWFFIFSLPLFIVIKRDPSKQKKVTKKTILGAISELKNTLAEIRKYRQILLFLVARLIYNDGLITIFAFGGIYAAGTFQFSFQEIMIFGIVLNIFAGLGALTMGFLDDRIGGKKTILVSLAGLVIAGTLAVFAPSKSYFWIAGCIVGIFSGPNQSASRSLMARLVPRGKENEFFGFFAFSGKFTSFLGPFLLGTFTHMFHSQRVGVSIVILFFIIGGIILSLVDEAEGMKASGR